MSFLSLGLSENLCNHLNTIGFTSPTPIQQLAIPKVIANADVMASAQTGTGKTGSFLLPMIDYLTHSRTRNRLPRLLILEPTRELALQVFEQFHKFSSNKLRAVLLVGGESNVLQERALQKGVDVIIATPGRFMDLYDRAKILLHDIKTLVIDEADRMMDMGFIPDIDRITKILPDYRQTVLFSATFNAEIEKLSNKYMINPKRISTEEVNKAATTIDQYLCIADTDKKAVLQEILKRHEDQQAIVFCNQKRDIIQLVNYLNKKNYNAIDLHGDLTQDQRTKRLEEFKQEKYKLLIASDIAARGIDIPDLGVVINFDVPLQAEDYVHRIGRTGRAGSKGTSYLISEKKNDRKLLQIQKLINEDINVLELHLKEEEKNTAVHVKAPSKIRSKKEESTVTDIQINFPPKIRARKEEKELQVSTGFGNFVPAFILKDVKIA